ncbi:MAG: chromosomal replication initiator protein DnaA [Actinomycetota bacterium]|nr:chromosomal replication initiator protein DnaA [Actinomycetota bacterium]
MTSSLAETPPAEPGDAAEAVWLAVLDRARRELPESSFELWFSGLRPGDLQENSFEIITPSAYVKSRLSAQHMGLITGAVRDVLGSGVVVRLRAPSSREDDGSGKSRRRERTTTPGQATLEQSLEESPFPNRYMFDTFVTGPSNKFAHAAALAVAESPPSKAYNPVFMYGGVGLGKTHLLFAIANHLWTLSRKTRVRYVTSESFVTEFIKAVRERRGYLFQRQYRDVDVLLLDDVQFLARAEETQTEFFHTFNHLHQYQRQIVIASDRPPQELGGIEERLRSRFRSGLVVDIQPPDLETRIAILQLKALHDGLSMPDEVLHFIASKFEDNIRELEGALLRVAAFASLTRRPADLRLAEESLEDLIPESGQEILPVTILEETGAYFGLTPDDLVSKSRSRPMTTARHMAMYLLRELTGLSLIKIGERFDRDHTTVIHGIRKIESLMPARGSVYRQVQELTKKIRAKSRGG